MDRKYFIYKHTSPSGKVYIGQTVNIAKRWQGKGNHYKDKKENGSYVQPIFARALDKYGWDNFTHEILLEGISKSEADYAEKYLIKWYKLHGISYNITDGGEGTCGLHTIISEERRKKISEFMRTNHPMKGKHHTPEALAKISLASKGRKLSKEEIERRRVSATGRTHTELSKKKLSEYKRAHPETWIGGWNAKEVHQYDLNGQYVTSFHSASEACMKFCGNSKRASDILECASGKRPSALEYVWRFDKVNSINLSNYKVINTKFGKRLLDMSPEAIKTRKTKYHNSINQYSLDGKYLNTFESISIAAEETQSNYTGISKCCRHLPRYKTASGYLWEFDTVDNRKDKIITA